MSSSEFQLFVNLPPELRDQIWHAALPGKLGPALYFYKNLGCWSPRRYLPSEHGYDHNDPPHLLFEFRHELLEVLHIDVPLYFVNHEARDISEAWLGANGIKICVNQTDNNLSHVFACRFNPVHDVLYVGPERWTEFYSEPDDRSFQPDMLGQVISQFPPLVQRLAVSEGIFRNEHDAPCILAEIVERYYCQVKILYVIIDTPRGMQVDGNLLWRWEFNVVQGGSFIWNRSLGHFNFTGHRYANEDTYNLLDHASREMSEEFVRLDTGITDFEVCPVVAVMR